MTTREEAMNALLALLAPQGGDFVTSGRRNRSPENFKPAMTPALMLLDQSETYQSDSADLPPVRRMKAMAIVYFDVGSDENAIPSSRINQILDRIDAALRPDDALTRRQTLGGLVRAVTIDGTIVKAPGDVSGKSLAVVPLTILLP